MRHLATAIVDAAAFFELSDDRTIDPDDAATALEQMAAELACSGPDEIAALQHVLDQRLAEASTAAEKTFYREFLSSFGLTVNRAP